MFKTKEKKTIKRTNKKEELLTLLKAKTPRLFDRDPMITGNLDKFADQILEIVS